MGVGVYRTRGAGIGVVVEPGVGVTMGIVEGGVYSPVGEVSGVVVWSGVVVAVGVGTIGRAVVGWVGVRVPPACVL